MPLPIKIRDSSTLVQAHKIAQPFDSVLIRRLQFYPRMNYLINASYGF